MGRILKPIAIGLGAAVLIAATGGIGLIGQKLAISGIKAVRLIALTSAAAGALSYFQPQRSSLLAYDPKSAAVDPATPRKFLLGQGLFFADLRWAEPWGPNQERIDYIFVLAAHRSHAVDQIWIGDKLAWTPGGGVTSDFAGYLTVEIILEAGVGAFHTAGTSGRWGAGQRLTGCTTAKLSVKRSDNSKSSQSPFGNGLGGVQLAFVGRGMPVYDPALDSTVPGGSGPQRADDCSTWAWEAGGVERGRNPALQQLAYRLGWRINGRRSVGQGIPPALINRAEYAVAAAQCDEAVALAGGGSARRFEAGLWATDADDARTVVQQLNLAMNGRQTSRGGQIGLKLALNDLAAPVTTLTTADVIGPFEWTPVPPLAERYTVVRGSYTSGATSPPWGAAVLPEVAVPRLSLVPRPLSYDLKAVQRTDQGQRIFKQVAQRSLLRGQFQATFGSRALLLAEGDVFRFTFHPQGWVNKLFRVLSIRPAVNGISVIAQEESAALYAWDREESPAVVPVVPVKFDQRNALSWRMAGIAPAADETAQQLPALPRGEWEAGRDYKRGDMVLYFTAVYAAEVDHTATTGNRPPDAVRWRLIAPAGNANAARTFSTSVNGSSTVTLNSFTVRAGNAGEVVLSTDIAMANGAGSAASNGGDFTWQRFNGSIWVNVGGTLNSPPVAPGASTSAINVARTATGLTPGTEHQFRLLCDRDGPAFDPLDPSANVITVSGTMTGQGQ